MVDDQENGNGSGAARQRVEWSEADRAQFRQLAAGRAAGESTDKRGRSGERWIVDLTTEVWRARHFDTALTLAAFLSLTGATLLAALSGVV